MSGGRRLLADRIRGFVVDCLERLETTTHLPDLLEKVVLEAVPRLCLRSDRGEEVDQSSVGVAQDHRAVAPRHIGWLQYDEVLDPFPDRVDVIDAQFDKDRVILAG
jgi:hypothetical protein